MHKILIANRGEIALRIMRTCQQMAIRTVAVYSEADQQAPFVDFADEAVALGGMSPTESYLDQKKIIQAAQLAGAEAIHPGYGFLSENADFARLCQEEGIIFIGPSPEAITAMGSKAEAKKIMQKNDVPTIPGYEGENQDVDHLIAQGKKIGFPLLVKASAGGGGKGMKIVRTEDQLKPAIESAKREARNSFGHDHLILEKYFESVRHIEIQIIGDQHGQMIHLGERECSVQRRYQKIIEEAPSPFLDATLRNKMGWVGIRAGQAIDYSNAGTVEFIVDEEKNFYFLEVNTRLQVEHPVTEYVTGVDLVEMQIEVARGKPLPFLQEDLQISGHAIEYRIYAEEPQKDFSPAIGTLHQWSVPEGIRVDSGVQSGSEVSTFYDPMLAKVILHGKTREEIVEKSPYLLSEITALGVQTNQAFLVKLVREEAFQKGQIDTQFIEKHPHLLADLAPSPAAWTEAAMATLLYDWSKRQEERKILPHFPAGWRNNFYQPLFQKYQTAQGEEMKLSYRHLGDQRFEVQIHHESISEPETEQITLLSVDRQQVTFQRGQLREKLRLAVHGDDIFVKHEEHQIHLKRIPRLPETQNQLAQGSYQAPMPGEVVKIMVETGQAVQSGDPLLIINSMKMENTIYAFAEGTVEEIYVQERDLIQADDLLVKIG